MMWVSLFLSVEDLKRKDQDPKQKRSQPANSLQLEAAVPASSWTPVCQPAQHILDLPVPTVVQPTDMNVLVTQLCPALWNPMACSLPGSSVHGILQLRILEWVAIPFPGESSQPRDRTWVFPIVGRFFTAWATREALANIYVYIDWKREILISCWFCFSGECWEIQWFFFFFF